MASKTIYGQCTTTAEQLSRAGTSQEHGSGAMERLLELRQSCKQPAKVPSPVLVTDGLDFFFYHLN
jgi:hypothetical protein